MRGDKIGIIGPNGAGKTTLLAAAVGPARAAVGQRPPRHESARSPTSTSSASSSTKTPAVADNVADGNETLSINGQSRHVLGYLQDFLFTPERARTPVRFLSGGERNRLLLARLFSKPANVLVLDEPTNDLDLETLELLEEQLVEFDGTLLLVSHDRAFLNNVVTSTIVFEPGGVREYVGGYDDWLRQRSAEVAEASEQAVTLSKEKRPAARRNRRQAPAIATRAAADVQGKAGARIAAGEDRQARRRDRRAARRNGRAGVLPAAGADDRRESPRS